jgi:RNA polymerase sigma-70 factor (ECF subfamily)
VERIEQPDEDLVTAIAADDRRALAALYDRHAPSMLAIAVRLLGDRREAEDLLHDVFVEVQRQARTFDPCRGTVRTWLLVRLRSRALDRRRAVGVARAASEQLAPGDEACDEDGLAPDRARVLRALAALPDEQRRVLELGYFEGLSSAEIAEQLAVPIGTVKSRVAAAMAKLRSALADPVAGGAR